MTATGNESVVGTLEAAKEKKVLMIGTAFDSAALAPDTIVTTALVNFDALAEEGMCGGDDLSLFAFADTAEEAWRTLVARGLTAHGAAPAVP